MIVSEDIPAFSTIQKITVPINEADTRRSYVSQSDASEVERIKEFYKGQGLGEPVTLDGDLEGNTLILNELGLK